MEFPIVSRTSLACWMAGRKLPAYADGQLAGSARESVSAHLRECAHCAGRLEAMTQTRELVRTLRPVTAPKDLTTRLRIIASREHARRASGNPWFDLEPLLMRLRNLMQPLAIPFAGGIVSTLVLFSMLVPSYSVGVPAVVSADVPTAFYTDPAVKTIAPFAFSSDELVVDLVVDEQGRVVDYSLPNGPSNVALRRAIENSLLFTTFTPAMAFGQPTSGKVRLSFRRSQIDVRG